MSTERPLSRRDALGGLAAAAALAALSPADVFAAPPPLSIDRLDCIVTPSQEEGPYFVDERLARSDIRVDPTTGKASAGTPLALRVVVASVNGSSCAPLANAMVDLWQCDAVGVYSDVRDQAGRFDSRGKKFLRGHQVTDAQGVARFTTIYPGWYEGRTVHIHFKVRHATHTFTSQWYFDEAMTDEVHRSAAYAKKGKRTRNTEDEIYRDQHGAGLILPVTRSATGYNGTYSIGMKLA